MSSINEQRLYEIFKAFADGHYQQSQAIGALDTLTTTEKSSLVGALNEIKAALDNLPRGTNESEVNRLIETRLSALIGNAPSNLDTLQEITEKLAADDTAVSAILTKLSGLQTRVEALEANVFEIPATWLADLKSKMGVTS